MAYALVNTSTGQGLADLMIAGDIVPGEQPSYVTCKKILTLHPLGDKMAGAPVKMAQSQAREITVADAPDRVVERFQEVWRDVGADTNILNLGTLSRAYGIASILVGAVGIDPDKPLTDADYSDREIYFNVLDPLNTAGSLVLNQNPNAPDFQKHGAITVNGTRYHRSRSCVLMNEQPIYIDFTVSAYGFVGRSVYQRAFYPLKSYIRTMITDDLVARKSGVIVAMMEQAGSIADNVMAWLYSVKRSLLKEAETDNVLSIAVGEKIESLNLENIDKSMTAARTDILLNCAMAGDMPARWLNNETFVEGFGEGTEDARAEARYVDRLRIWLNVPYAWHDNIVQRRAWNPKFIEMTKRDYPALYGAMSTEQIFYAWRNAFRAAWPSMLIEPDSEKSERAERKFKSAVAEFEVLEPILDPENKARAVQWMVDTVNEEKDLFPIPLNLNFDALLEHLKTLPPPAARAPAEEPEAPPAFSARA